jgi:DeoR family glycerol-3-phosphate regulon repressor
MFANERRDMIAKMVDVDGRVEVKDLSRHFEVTEDSIRKDLAILEKAGRIERTHGGAVRKRVNPHALYVAQRADKNREAKQAIAKKALSLIHAEDTIFLDSSTSNSELATLIVEADLNIRVVTTMLDVMLRFTVPCKTELVFLGGTFNPEKDGFAGPMTIEAIQNFHFDTAFMGVVGIDPFINSVETYQINDAMTKKAALDQSRARYLMLETRKFDQKAPFKYARLEDFTGLIIEKPLSDRVLKNLSKYHLDII